MKTAETIKKYKTPLMIAGVALVGYTFYRVYRKRNPTDASALTQDEKDAKAKGQNLSYTLSSYQGAADTIFNAWFQRFNPLHPVDETIVLSVMSKMKNDLDVIQLIRAFGKRRSPVNFLSLLTPNVSLPEWINIGLTEPQIAAINTVLSKKGISYKF
jgi:hypothetical protein